METESISEKTICVGCNYHTKWQKHKAMRFVLADLVGGKALLKTRTTGAMFLTKLDDLVFIMTQHNIRKAVEKSNGTLTWPKVSQ